VLFRWRDAIKLRAASMFSVELFYFLSHVQRDAAIFRTKREPRHFSRIPLLSSPRSTLCAMRMCSQRCGMTLIWSALGLSGLRPDWREWV
jgi:hypothetical protein